jgi:hypothetical protein
MTPGTDAFFAFARERYRIHLARSSGAPGPWTEDPTLREWRFCNVFREDDRTTAWFRENLREPMREDPGVLFATIAFRWFNKIETGKALLRLLTPEGWNRDRAIEICRGLEHPFTGAYVIKSPNGFDKVTGICNLIEMVHAGQLGAVSLVRGRPLHDAWEILQGFPFLGPFMSFEVVTDLRHTALLSGAPDINLWANPGPGCRRGLDWIAGRKLEKAELLPAMQSLLMLSRFDYNWPEAWPGWEMREVEHLCCEWDKYCRARIGERLKRRYTSKS